MLGEVRRMLKWVISQLESQIKLKSSIISLFLFFLYRCHHCYFSVEEAARVALTVPFLPFAGVGSPGLGWVGLSGRGKQAAGNGS